MEKLYIVALFRFKSTHLQEATELLKTLVTETRKEEGCLQYDLIEDKETAGTYFLIELWDTEEHHRKHGETAHLAEFRERSAPATEISTVVYKGFKIF